jgi:hypothetical protein
MTDRIVYLGDVAVDSGHLMVVDPCYVLNDTTYDRMCERILQLHEDGKDADKHGGEFDASGPAKGVVFESGLGDGWYTVEAVVGDVPGWGERVKRVTITLIEEEVEDGEDPDLS